MKKISIITINRNNKEGLKKTIESVLFQTFHDFEFIIIDGNSTDGSQDIIKEFETRIDYWVSEPDSGIYNAMNKGIKRATTEFCLFMNSGDCFYHDNVLFEIFSHDLSGDIICGNAFFENYGNFPEKIVYSPEQNYKVSDLILNSLPHQSTLIRTQLFKDYHFYDEKYLIFSDWAFNVEMLILHHKKYQKINVLISRCDSTGISSNPDSESLMNQEFDSVFKELLPHYYDDFKELSKNRLKENHIDSLLLKKIEKTIFFRIILYTRRKLIKYGLYRIKNNIKKKYHYSKIKREDNKKKKEIDKAISLLPEKILPAPIINEPELIVSLTSYGRRVKESVPYTIYSLFQQAKLPNRIVLYLDHDNWNDNNLPDTLKRLKKSGLEIYYCEDIRSYKKLIPALRQFPSSIIITVDDDMYYNSNLILELYKTYTESDKKSVICHFAMVVDIRNGKYTLTKEWRKGEEGNEYSIYSAVGVGGVLYPPGIFDDEILKTEIFTELAPTSDDLWFWVMELRNGVKVILTKNSQYLQNVGVDRLNQLDDRQTDGLFYENCILGKNDIQLKKLFEYYKINLAKKF